MKIVPKRTMFLDGKRVEAGKPVEVSQSEGELALRHRWASEEDAGAKGKKAKADGDAE